MKRFTKKIGLLLLTGWVGAVSLFGVLVFATPTFAAGEGLDIPLMTASACRGEKYGTDVCEGLAEFLEKNKNEFLGPQLAISLVGALLNIMTYALDTIAYQAAVAIATGGEGETPLIYSEDPKTAWGNFGLDLVGETLGTLSEDVLGEQFGIEFNLCAPPDPLLKLALQVGLKQAYQPREPRCDFQEIQANWDGFIAGIADTVENPTNKVVEEFAKGLRPGRNELSASIQLNIKVQEKVLLDKQLKLAEQLTSTSGFKAVKDLVTGQVQTPSGLLARNFESEVFDPKNDTLNASVNAAILNPNLIGQLFFHSAGTFTNTLLSSVLNKWVEGFFDVQPEVDFFDVDSVAISGLEQAQERFASLVSTQPFAVQNYNALAEFATCTPGGTVANRNINNCVMDAPLLSAVGRAEAGVPMTVQEAIDEGLLHGNWVLYPPSDYARNGDDLCYTYGYCYGNLVKMRKARILPVGWEIAASRNEGTNPATLQEIVDGFNDCDDQGTIDSDTHKWCHLIDPNWILKYPESQCHAFVNGEVTVSSLTNGRNGYCADVVSCLGEDSKGTCTDGYGYCVREENTWNFRGDECPAEYGTCLSFKNTSSNESVDYLLNTVDFSICGQDNAGCLWYRTNKYFDDAGTVDDPTDDTFEWLATGDDFDTVERESDIRTASSVRTNYDYDTGGAVYDYDTYSYEDRIYFTNDVEACSADSAGCTQLYEIGETLVLNNIQNSSFETDANGDGVPDGWVWEGGASAGTYATTDSGAFSGSDSIVVETSDDNLLQENIILAPNAFYTLSFYAKAMTAGADVRVRVDVADEDGDAIDFAGTSSAGDCVLGAATGRYNTDASPAVDVWTRYSCTFTTTDVEAWASVRVIGTNALEARVDALQLEYGAVATAYTADYNDTTPTTSYLIVPPDYLNCTGSALDPAECEGYTQVCSATQVGCTLYTPEDGDPSVPAIASDLDSCPSECAGYDTFKQEPTKYELADFPLFFIPSQATSCSAANVGCDGFTNLDSLAEGGEGVEYYTDLRACATPDMANGATSSTVSANFFTWEGSDATGYQLRSWQLLESVLAPAPVLTYTEAGADSDEHPDLAPCVEWQVTSEAVIQCVEDASTRTRLSTDDSCNEHDDIFTNPDCREFYDSEGNIHYRLFSETVTISPECHPYRKTDPGGEANCVASGGFFTVAGECRYFGLPEESAECPANANGCRMYTGGAGRNASTIFFEDFENGDVGLFVGNLNAAIFNSNESVAPDGHSMRIATSGPSAAVELPSGTFEGLIVPGKTFQLEFWAKGSGSMRVSLTEGGSGDEYDFVDPNDGEGDLDPIALTSNWQLYELGPLDSTGLSGIDEDSSFHFYLSNPDTMYVDNIALKQVEENITIIKDSWVVPSTCDTTPTGAVAPQYYLGCEAYRDQDANTSYLYQFSNICSEEVVGCQAFYDTQNSPSTSAQVFNARCYYNNGNFSNASPADLDSTAPSNTDCFMEDEAVCTISSGREYCVFDIENSLPNPLPSNVVFGPEAVVVKNDQPVFLVDNGSTTCSAANMGCEEVGVPTYNQEKTAVTGFESAYLINLPASYDSILCENEALFCEEWASNADGNYYFKDPFDQTCEWKTNVTLGTKEYQGWFRAGTDEPCSWEDVDGSGDFQIGVDTSLVISGNQFGVWRNGDELLDRDGSGVIEADEGYTGWVAECASQYDRCTEFIDTSDTQNGNQPTGVKYYFIKDELLDDATLVASQRCDGQVSRKAGCALFQDTTSTEIRYASGPSYMASQHADYLYGNASDSLVDPIDCSQGQTNKFVTPPGSGTELNLCAMRCGYQIGAAQNLTVGNGVNSSFLPNVELTGACITDQDCPALQATDGETYAGTCYDVRDMQKDGIDEDGDGQNTDDNDSEFGLRWFNDTNTVLKVTRDRECAAWLTSPTTQPTWNTRTNTWEEISDRVDLCWEQSSSLNCELYQDSEPIALSTKVYVDRDVTWTGLEYSGYAIPEQLPMELLDARNINPTQKVCFNFASEKPVLDGDGQLITCTDDSVCGGGAATVCTTPEADLRLLYAAGSCDLLEAGWGGQCNIGFCADGKNNCVIDGDCAIGDECVFGYCQIVNDLGPACTKNDDCAGTDVGGVDTNICDPILARCVNELTPNGSICDATGSGCSALATCQPAALSKQGSCYNDICLTDVYGQPIENVKDAEASSCRGYPEVLSPFPTSKLVTTWKDPSDPNDTDDEPGGADWIPYEKVFGFQEVEVCAPDQNGNVTDECVCSYDKATYGQGATTLYYPKDTAIGAVLDGVCSGGNLAGAACSKDEDCNDGTPGTFTSGFCERIAKKETYFGWDGYCIERDSSIQLFGSTAAADRPCITWLPVDQAPGSTNLFAKSTEAGQFIGDEVYYCAETDIAYDIGTTQNVACAEAYGGNCNDGGDWSNFLDHVENDGECRNSINCPDAYFAVMTGCGGLAPISGTEPMCKDPGLADNDCPFFCVPKLAYSEDQASDCTKPGSGDTDWGYTLQHPDSRPALDIYILEADDFMSAKDWYDDCEVRGVVDSLDSYLEPYDTLSDLKNSLAGPSGYRNLSYNLDPYLACTSVVQVSGDDNAAWTDRTWDDHADAADNYILNPLGTLFSFDVNAPLEVFGRAVDLFTLDELRPEDMYPLSPVMCNIEGLSLAVGAIQRPPTADLDCSTFGPGSYALGNVNDLQTGEDARLYFDSQLQRNISGQNSEYCKEANCTCSYNSEIEDCNWDDGLGRATECNGGTCSGGPADGEPCSEISDCIQQTCVTTTYKAGGNEYTSSICSSDESSYAVVNVEDPSVAEERLRQIFAKTYEVYSFTDGYFNVDDADDNAVLSSWAGGSGAYAAASDAGLRSRWIWDYTNVGDGVKSPVGPTMRAIGDCFSGLCREDAGNAMSLNGLAAQDHDVDAEFYHAELNFFAFADEDQMPIRTIIVDWGSGDPVTDAIGDWGSYQSGSTAPDNYYKNHRGLTGADRTTTWCSVESEWGETAESCDESYITFTNDYKCTDNDVLEYENAGRNCEVGDRGQLLNSPCTGGLPGLSGACVFQPRVFIEDNWGWCTGFCDSNPEDSTDGCYASECNFQYCPGGGFQCPDIDGDVTDPWVYYDGLVILRPE